jgi:alkylhydroperoxidase family enzyme
MMATTTEQRLRELHPESAAALAQANATAWASADAPTLELCRLRVVDMLGGVEPRQEVSVSGLDSAKREAVGGWATSDLFSPVERAHLEFAEQFVMAVGNISDEQVAKLLEFRSEKDVYTFAAALYTIELTQRMTMMLDKVFETSGMPR